MVVTRDEVEELKDGLTKDILVAFDSAFREAAKSGIFPIDIWKLKMPGTAGPLKLQDCDTEVIDKIVESYEEAGWDVRILDSYDCYLSIEIDK